VSCTRREIGGLRDISLRVEQGEWLTVFGPPGAGKSTLLQVLAGEIEPDEGEVTAQRPFYIPQVPPPPGRGPVRGRLLQRLVAYGLSSSRAAAGVALGLEIMNIEALREAPERSLTPVQRALVELAFAIAAEPQLLLLDDILAAAPEPNRDKLLEYLNGRRAADGLAVVHATCSSRDAELSDRVLILDAGEALVLEATGALLRDYAPETVTVEAADPSSVQRTLRGIFDVSVVETRDGLRFAAVNPEDVAAHLFRHPAGGVRVVYSARGDLWQVHAALVNKKRLQPPSDQS
jgi:ABC-type sulfate/molybdate transport systems ATPase subunit